MKTRVEYFVAFFIKTFLLINFVIGSLTYIFTADRISPGLEPTTMLWIAAGIAIVGVLFTLRQSQRIHLSEKTES